MSDTLQEQLLVTTTAMRNLGVNNSPAGSLRDLSRELGEIDTFMLT